MSKNYGFEYADFQQLGATAYASGTGFSTSVKTSSGLFFGLMVSAASNTPTLAIYDNTAATGTALFSTFTPVAGTLYRFDTSVKMNYGVYVYGTGSILATIAYA